MKVGSRWQTAPAWTVLNGDIVHVPTLGRPVRRLRRQVLPGNVLFHPRMQHQLAQKFSISPNEPTALPR
jgi:hypothetical protein